MPHFFGNRSERWALANYIVNGPDLRDPPHHPRQAVSQSASSH